VHGSRWSQQLGAVVRDHVHTRRHLAGDEPCRGRRDEERRVGVGEPSRSAVPNHLHGSADPPSHVRDERALISRIDAIVPQAAMARRAGLQPEVHVETHRELGRHS
jgi:hypothetical protein